MMSTTRHWKNRTTILLLATVGFFSGCGTFQSQNTAETNSADLSSSVKEEMKQISPELKDKITLEAEKAIHTQPALESVPPLEKVTESLEEKPSQTAISTEVKYGKREGTKGRVKYIYEGDLRGDTYHGKGKLSYANGFSYEGEFKNGEYDGYGVATDTKRKSRYEGQFKEGRYEGQGSMTYSNGDRYQGEFRRGKRHGQGVLIKANGQRQAGQFVDDKFSAK